MEIYPVYSNVSVFKHTYDITKEVKLDGAIVECGVAAGSNFAQMIKASIDSGIDRKYYGFDSFQGIPFGVECDGEQPGIGQLDATKYGVMQSTGITVHNKSGVIENLRQWNVLNDNIHLIEGWFQDTIPVNDIDKIAVLRLDGDLYESTKVCLEHLYSKVQKGGLVIIDDYELAGCCKAVHEFIKGKRIKLQRFEYTAYWYK
jgi:O-methyltransferase